MDLRVDATPPGNMNRAPVDEEDVTGQSYDDPPDEVSHGVSASVGLTILAVVMWVSVMVGEHAPGFWSLRTASCILFVLFFFYWWRYKRWQVSILTMLVVGAVGLVGGSSAWREVPVIDGACSGNATVRTDPTWVGNGVGVVLELHGKRYRVIAHGAPGAHLANRLAGEHVMVTGTCSKTTGPYSRYDRITHVVGRMTVQSVSEDFSEGSIAVRAANRMRVALRDGVALMPRNLQALFAGLVIGDDRDQSREMVSQFRASGLSHLCAVSGQNVAYLLAALSPVLRRLRRNGRFIAVLMILAWFVLLTRAEPSVLRAAVMAGLVAVNAASGTSMNARTILASTVIVLLVLDPMLAWSVGFALSVGATAGLAWLSARLGNIIGRHGMLAATLAAQVGTMPVSFFVFGYVPVVSLIANPLALWVAGMVMMVGLPLALLASLLTPLVPLVSWAMTIPVAWVAGVARICSEVSPHGSLNVGLWLCVTGGIWHRWRRTVA